MDYKFNIFMYGLAGTGKDTVAELMHHNHDIYSLALADPIREEYVKFYDTDDFKLHRERMIAIGEGYKKIYGQDVWCDLALRDIYDFHEWIEHLEETVSNPPNVTGAMVRDGRYNHEYEYFVVKNGFVPVRLVTDDSIRLERLRQRDKDIQMETLQFEKKNFISDDAPAFTLFNNGGVDDLEHNIAELLEMIKDSGGRL